MATILHPPALDAINAFSPRQGRSERTVEAYFVCYVEALSDARTTSGNGASWRAGVWAGVNTAIFTILLWRSIQFVA